MFNYDELRKKIGKKYTGYEDFDFFKCPNCGTIYLIDTEIDAIYVNPENLNLISYDSKFTCIKCGYDFAEQIIVGPKSSSKFKVDEAEIEVSKWNWAISA